MTTLEKIKNAASMGYSAILKKQTGDYTIVGLTESDAWVKTKTEFIERVLDPILLNRLEITGYLYVGHLFGEPVIPKGQRFRVKATGEIGECTDSNEIGLRLKITFENIDDGIVYETYSFDQLEPVFE